MSHCTTYAVYTIHIQVVILISVFEQRLTFRMLQSANGGSWRAASPVIVSWSNLGGGSWGKPLKNIGPLFKSGKQVNSLK